ncbi:hypothetical protein ACIBF5_29175 [Micromonospora sp. NPDC050417]|uniref:hypothetical protein n=1 Tax=Micromonospora sp. NPDC050417 TaxID=3364280 RepID=UPI00378D69BC
MRVRTRAMVAAGVALAAVAAFGVYLGSREIVGKLPLPTVQGCTVQADGQVNLNPEQMANAATIAAIGVQRKMPEQAVVVALATAFQESRLENLAGGDRDSIGLFQQRPSQGWGTPEEIRDPRYAAKKFYAALKKVKGWEAMRVTDAAQRVQRSAFPEAYEKWADESAVLTRALLGNATGAVACTVGSEPLLRGAAAAAALTHGLNLDWGKLQTTVPAELTGLAVPAANLQTGWRYAHWLVSHARDNGVKRVSFENLEWTADDGTWAPVENGSANSALVVAEVYAEG